jgi:hypothetical protein
VRDDWKLIVGSQAELYNLAQDPTRFSNLARRNRRASTG